MLDVWNGIAVKGIGIVQCAIVTSGCQSIRSFLGDHVYSGGDQLLEEGWNIPSCSIW